ncbi:hypothetical protein [Rhizobium halophilum]|uniref:hypothetical protein n=1 Tax=Rhizobium halophilum TaxID=2846852 RepID=UPI001EFED0B9|nr:hypothetical protein [Rhizobium halophilum]MCF6368336.1 hypothetical protein [Rhizobium halophilum]
MSGPFIPARAAQPFDLLEKGAAGGGWDALEEMFKPVLQDRPLQPGDEVAKFMWGLANTPEGRAMFEWMMDVSIRQPMRVTGETIEQTALAAAVRQGINGFAEAVLAAIAHGEKQVREARQKT